MSNETPKPKIKKKKQYRPIHCPYCNGKEFRKLPEKDMWYCESTGLNCFREFLWDDKAKAKGY